MVLPPICEKKEFRDRSRIIPHTRAEKKITPSNGPGMLLV
jgi:hypothetical protein